MKIIDAKYNFLVQQYKNRIYNYSFLMLRNAMDAEDVTQEVLIKIWQNLGKFKMLSSKTWIMRTTHNLCIDYIRKRKTLSMKNLLAYDDLSEVLPANLSDNPDNLFEKNLTENLIIEAIKRLPENLRSVFVLYEINGLKYREISKTLELPINSVKVYLLRARKQLQLELNELKLQGVI